MRKLSILFVLALVTASSAYAQCPTEPFDVCMGGGFCWWDYSPAPESECVVITGDPTPTTGSMCYSRPSAIPATGGWADLSYTFTVDQYNSFQYWHAEASVDINDPNNSLANGVEIYAGVHVGGSPQWQFVAKLTGADGDYGCETVWGSFSADPGDTVTVVVYAFRADSNATVEASIPRLFNTNFP